jgi:hypothetical protein
VAIFDAMAYGSLQMSAGLGLPIARHRLDSAKTALPVVTSTVFALQESPRSLTFIEGNGPAT